MSFSFGFLITGNNDESSKERMNNESFLIVINSYYYLLTYSKLNDILLYDTIRPLIFLRPIVKRILKRKTEENWNELINVRLDPLKFIYQ